MTSSDGLALDGANVARDRARVGAYVEGTNEGRGLRVALACARFNGSITQRLLDGALTTLADAGVARSDVTVAWVPGAYELPLAALALADGAKPNDAVIALGAVIRGETGHYEVVANECARGLQDVQLSTRVPVIFGVLTVNTVEQALERSRPDATNKGREAAFSALEMVTLLRHGSLEP